MSKHAGGRPPKYDTSEDMQHAIDDYFEYCYTNGENITVSGLAYSLGFESRQSFYDYGKNNQFSYIIKRCRLRLESYYESRVQGTTPTGSIFVLKNMGWKDEHTVHQDSKNVNTNINYNDLSEEESKKLFSEMLNNIGKE